MSEFEPSAKVDLQQLLDSDSDDNTVYGDRRGTKQNHEVMEQRNNKQDGFSVLFSSN